MITALKHGDEIVTNSGILGKVTGITDKVVTVEVADNVKVKMLKSQVSQVVKGSIKELSS
jgi:preprotein translocase subunit YajC